MKAIGEMLVFLVLVLVVWVTVSGPVEVARKFGEAYAVFVTAANGGDK